MSSILNGRRDSWSRLFKTFSFVTAATVFLLSRHLPADMPEYGMATLAIDDHGGQLICYWHVFYSQMPAQFILREMQDKPISLRVADARLLRQNLSDIAQVAFDLKIDGQTVQPTLVKLTAFDDKSFSVIQRYPGHAHSEADLQAPILQYLPPGYVFNVRISSSTGTKGALFRKNSPPVVHFAQGENKVSRPLEQPLFSKAFTVELGTAWVNYNWILICAVLLLMRQPKQIAALIASIVVCWILLCFASVVFDYKVPFKIPEIVLCLPTLLLCVICIKYPNRVVLFTLVTGAAGLLNACYDIQQIPLSNPAQTVNALAGLSLGFVGGIALVLLVLVPLWWECKKYPGFQESWAPRISWAIAGLAVFLPLQKWLFG